MTGQVPLFISAGIRHCGAVDHLGPLFGLRGWLLDTESAAPTPVVLRCAGQVLATSETMMDRADIDALVNRQTWCGFLIGWSRIDRATLAELAREQPEATVEVATAPDGPSVSAVIDMPAASALLDMIAAAPQGDRQPRFAEANDYLDIRAAGLFDAAWYMAREGAAIPPGMPPLLDYLRRGESAGAWPNPNFDPAAYAVAHGLAGPAGALTDFLRRRNAPPALPVAAPGRPTRPRILEIGLDAAETKLRAMAPGQLAKLVAEAERELAADPNAAETALFLNFARRIAGDDVAAAEAAAAFLQAAAESTGTVEPGILQRLLHANHALHERQRGPLTRRIYQLLRAHGQRDRIATMRLLEAALDERDLTTAGPLARELESGGLAKAEVWDALALSRYYQLAGQRRRAATLLLAVPWPAPTPVAEAAVIHRLLECEAPEEAERRLPAAEAGEPVEIFGARLRIAAHRRDHAGLAALLAQERAAGLPDWLLAEVMFRTAVPGALPVEGPGLRAVRRLAEILAARDPTSPRVFHARVHYLLHGKRWAELGALFERIEGSELSRERETLLRRLEYLCHVDDAEAAERIYREHFRDTALNKWEGLTVMRLLSELKRWEEAAAALLAHVGRGYGFGGAGHMGMRIVRKAGIHEALLASVAEASEHEPDLESFIARVREDHAIVQTARALSASREGGRRGRRYRSNWILDASAEEEEDEHCVFLCTNQRYFLSMLTFLCSFLGQAPQASGRIFAFLDRDVPRHWHGAVAMVAARFGRSVELVSEPEFVPEAVEHRVEYGFFAGGSNLSRAAYFRLYAARWLLANHRFSRAAYIDTDTICRADLSGLFTLDLGDKLVAAAVEDYSPDVVNAAARNNLDPTAYFNSGVLLFRFDHPEMPAHIEEAIRISEQESERLVFHDQCALNIAFQGRTAPLPSRYNFYLRPSRERNGYIEDGAILHFLDKPKPWDIIFDRSYREEWRVWALMLGSILPQALYVDIFAQANRD